MKIAPVPTPLPENFSPADFANKIGLDKRSDRNKARLYLAGLAVVRLSSDPQTRNQLFFPAGDHEKGIEALTKEGSARRWQSNFLNRLVQIEIAVEIVGPEGRTYKRGDDEKGLLVVNDMFFGDQVGLKRILWPQDYGIGDSQPAPVEEQDNEEVEEEPEDANEASEVLEKVASSLQEVAGHLGELYTSTTKATEVTKASSETLQNLTKRLETGLAEFELLAGNEQRRFYSQLTDMANRLKESEIRKKSLMNQLESESRKAEELMREIKEVLARG